MIEYKELEFIIKNAGDKMLDSIESMKVYKKGYADFVTDKDLEIQKYIYEELSAYYPHIGFIGEESNSYKTLLMEKKWILDPIDGTTNYIYGYNMSAISLALMYKNNIVLGIVYNPFTKEFFYAEKGKGAYLNNKRISVSLKQSVRDALVAVGTSPYYKEIADDVFSKIKRIYRVSLDIRRTGSAALDLAYVACGRQDAYFECKLKPWDFAAGSLLVEEAGGVIKTIGGNPLVYDNMEDIVACCNEKLMLEMNDILSVE